MQLLNHTFSYFCTFVYIFIGQRLFYLTNKLQKHQNYHETAHVLKGHVMAIGPSLIFLM